MEKQGDHKKQIEQYLLNRMTEEEETRFQEHLLHCSTCRDELAKVRAVASLFMSEEPAAQCVTEEKFCLAKINWQRWLSVAACLLVLFGISLYRNRKRQASDNYYPTAVEYQHRAAQEAKPAELLFPDCNSLSVSSSQSPLLFRWKPMCAFQLQLIANDRVLLDIQGVGTDYTVPIAPFSVYPEIKWNLKINDITYSGQILVQTNL